jgi:hypothetical protein
MKRGGAVAIAIGVGLASPSAWGQSDRELATRQELIHHAQSLSDAGNHAEALALGKRAAAIKMSVSLRMFIAQEESADGKIADAYGSARQCAAEAEADAQLHDRERILATCRSLEALLEKRVGRVTIALPSPLPPGVRVVVAGEEVSPALLGAPYVVSPGSIAIEVTATGFAPYASSVQIGEGGTADITVQLAPEAAPTCPAGQVKRGSTCVAECKDGKVRHPPDAVECCWPGQLWDAGQAACLGDRQCPTGQVGHGSECVARPPSTPPAAAPPLTGESSKNWLGPAAIGGAGVLVGVVATIVWFNGDSRYSSLKAQCAAPGGCSTDTYNSGASTVRLDDGLGVGGWVVGGALVASGITWYLLGTSAAKDSGSAHLFLNPAARALGLAGAF